VVAARRHLQRLVCGPGPAPGAALASYIIFALAPDLVIVMALAGFLLGPGTESQILGQIRDLLGE